MHAIVFLMSVKFSIAAAGGLLFLGFRVRFHVELLDFRTPSVVEALSSFWIEEL